MNIPDQITELLETRTPDELAVLLGVARSTLERIAAGAIRPSVFVIRRMGLLAHKSTLITARGYDFQPRGCGDEKRRTETDNG